MGVGRGGGQGKQGGERRWEMDDPVMRVRGRDLYASYEGSYGVGGDVYAKEGATEWAGGVVVKLFTSELGIRAW